MENRGRGGVGDTTKTVPFTDADLTKPMGLNRILDPGTVKIRGCNAYHVTIALLAFYLCAMSTAIGANGVYYWNVARTTSIMDSVTSLSFVHMCYKVLVIVHHSDAVWHCLSSARSGSAAAFGRADDAAGKRRRLLRTWRDRTVRVVYAYAIVSFLPLFVYAVCPLAFDDATAIAAAGYYRPNVLNTHSLTLFDDVAYNAHFGWFYCVELASTVVYLLFSFVFDAVLVAVSVTVLCRLQMIDVALESVGRKTGNPGRPSAAGNEKKPSEDYDDLRSIIIEHQAIIQKLCVFIAIFRRVVLIQIVMSSVDIIFDWFTFTLCLIEKEAVDWGISTMKMLCLLPLFLFQLILPCYTFGRIHDQKDSIIFSLYNTNWTEMDLKCKRLILMTMGMNNAHRLKLKLSLQKIVNLEMFVGTVRVCYTVFSILLKYK